MVLTMRLGKELLMTAPLLEAERVCAHHPSHLVMTYETSDVKDLLEYGQAENPSSQNL